MTHADGTAVEDTDAMKKKQQAPTTFTTDAHGQRLAHVALANTDQRATLYAEDLEHLLAAGWSPHWQWCKTGARFRYVLVHGRTPSGEKKRTVTVARLLAGGGKGQRVEYIDGDRSNLRRDNLRIVRGGGYAVTPADALRPCHPDNLPEPVTLPQDAPVAVRESQISTAQPAPCTTPAGHPAKPEKAATHPVTAPAPAAAPVEAVAVSAAEPTVAFAHRVIDRAALSARVRQQVAQGNQR